MTVLTIQPNKLSPDITQFNTANQTLPTITDTVELNQEKPNLNILQKLASYLKPRPETTGNAPYSIPSSALISGALGGYYQNGVIGAISGAVSGYAGVKIGEDKNSKIKALFAGALTGAITNAAGSMEAALLAGNPAAGGLVIATALLGAVVSCAAQYISDKKSMSLSNIIKSTVKGAFIGNAIGAMGVAFLAGNPISGGLILTTALLGALTGTTAVLMGSNKAQTRDSAIGSALVGAIALTGNQYIPSIAGIAAGIGAKGKNSITRFISSAVLGGVGGGLLGNLAGTGFNLPLAGITAMCAGLGSIIGPLNQQFIRNFTADLSSMIIKKIEPILKKHKFTKKQSLAVGTLAYGLMAGIPSLYFCKIFGPFAPIAAGLGFTAGAVNGFLKTRKILKQKEQQKNLQQVIRFNNYIPIIPSNTQEGLAVVLLTKRYK